MRVRPNMLVFSGFQGGFETEFRDSHNSISRHTPIDEVGHRLFIANDRDTARIDKVGRDPGDTESCCTTD